MQSINRRILNRFVPIIVLAFFLIITFAEYNIKNKLQPHIIEITTDLLEAKANEVSLWFESRIKELDIIAENILISKMDRVETLKYLRSMRVLNDDLYESFSIVDLQGNAWITDSSTFNIASREYFQRVRNPNRDYYISDPIVSKGNKREIIVIIKKIRDDNETVKGYICGAVSTEYITKMLSKIEVKGQKVWISSRCNSKGIHTDNELIENIYDTDDIVLKEPIQYKENWVLGIRIPEDIMNSEINELIRFIKLIGVIILIITIYICMRFTKSIVKPIKKLEIKMEEAQKGDLTVRADNDSCVEINNLSMTFNGMILKIEELLELVGKKEESKKQAELKALHSQIKPHFLYNTLDTIQCMAMEYEADDVEEAIECLANLFRIGLSKDRNIITLDEELKHLKSYLYIQKLRYNEKLNYTINCDKDLYGYNIVKLILQPIVENSIYHGIKLKNEQGNIVVDIYQVDNYIRIDISDDGVGIQKEKLDMINSILEKGEIDSKSNGYGIYNVNQRLKMTFGNAYGVKIYSEEGEYTKVEVLHPLQNKGES